MPEIICIHVGQAGVQLSSTVWETFCTEHGIQSDGLLKNEDDEDQSFRAFFQEVPTGQFVPRAISIDLEPSVLDEIRAGPYRKLFHPDQLVSGFEDAANNFARGHFTLGKNYIDYSLNRVRKVIDICDNLEGFFVFNSYGGGTGSGFSSLLVERLNVEFTKKCMFQTAIYPGEKFATSTVEPYNTVLCTSALLDNTDLCPFFDNESLYEICSKSLDIPRPTYNNLNRVVSQIISSMTVSIRFAGYLNTGLGQIMTNLVPYPRIHFPVFTHAPILSSRKAVHQKLSTLELTRVVFDPEYRLVNCNMSEGKYMCCCLQYRGKITPKEVNEALFEIKRRTDIKFVDWCPTSFKLAFNSQPPPFIPRSEIAESDKSLSMLSNTTAIGQIFRKLALKFDMLFNKRAFLYWYVGEGMEEAEITNAREELSTVYLDYSELSNDFPEGDEVEEVEKFPEEKPVESDKAEENPNIAEENEAEYNYAEPEVEIEDESDSESLKNPKKENDYDY